MRDALIYSLIIALIVAAVGFAHRVWTLGNDPDDYQTICLEGHSYWRVNLAYKTAMASRLDHQGRPVRCEVQ